METQPQQRSWLEKLSQAFTKEPQDQQALLNILRDAEANQLLGADALAMIEGVMNVAEMHVRDIMIPRSQMVMVEADADSAEYLPLIIHSKHSRFPVYDDERDNVIGILLAKDLLECYSSSKEKTKPLQEMLLPCYFIPESKRLDVLLKEFQRKHLHMAIVVDEYGSTAGLITIEDILEQIVGEIEDEHDVNDEGYIKAHHEGHFTIKAHTTLSEFNDYFKTNFADDNIDTIGGFVAQVFGRLPKRGDVTRIGAYKFKVLNADNRRIKLLKMTMLPEEGT